MKRITENVLMLLVIILVAVFVGMTLAGCSTTESVIGPVRAGDVTNTGCQSHTRGTSIIGNPTLKLTKDGANLQAEFHDYRVNCAYKDVSVECAAKDGVLDIRVEEVMDGDLYANCLCSVNIYYTIYNANEEEYSLRLNGEDLGIISFKGHDVTEIDLWNHEQAHEEGFEYSLVTTDTYADEILHIEGREDWLPRFILSHYVEDLGVSFQFFLLPEEYNDFHMEAKAKGDTIMINIVTDGVITQDSPKRGNVACIFANATSSSYHIILTLQSMEKDSDGNLHETTKTVFDHNVDIPLGEQKEFTVRMYQDYAFLGNWQDADIINGRTYGKKILEDGTIREWVITETGEYIENDWGFWRIDEYGEVILKMGSKEPMPDELYYQVISVTDEEMEIREWGGIFGTPFEKGYDRLYIRIE